MAKINKAIVINAPVEKVFGYLDEPTNLPEIWPSLVETTEVKRLPNGGNFYRWTYKMAGLRFNGTSEDIEWVVNQRIVNQNKGGIDSTITWTFEPQGEGTKFTAEVEYKVPVPLIGRIAEATIVKMNEHETEVFGANLKARMEE